VDTILSAAQLSILDKFLARVETIHGFGIVFREISQMPWNNSQCWDGRMAEKKGITIRDNFIIDATVGW